MNRTKTLLIAAFMFAATIATAGTREPDEKRIEPEDVYGSVSHAGKDKPLKDVMITAFLQSKKEKIVLTNTNGEYGLDNLPPGTYKIVFEKDGFRKVVKDKVIIKPNSGIELNIEMEAKGFDLGPSPFHFIEL
jgi:hypothetical protein